MRFDLVNAGVTPESNETDSLRTERCHILHGWHYDLQ